jgi:hypothetical protein
MSALVACGSDNSNGSDPSTPIPKQTYNGAYSGDDTGQWTFTLYSDDSIKGCLQPDLVNIVVPLIGYKNGSSLDIDVASQDSGSTFTGSVTTDGNVSGSWSAQSNNATGAFVGSVSNGPVIDCSQGGGSDVGQGGGSDVSQGGGNVSLGPNDIDEKVVPAAFQIIKVLLHLTQQTDPLTVGVGVDPGSIAVPLCIEDNFGVSGSLSLNHNGIDNPQNYSLVYDQCMTQASQSLRPGSKISGTVEADGFYEDTNFNTSSVNLRFTDYQFNWDTGSIIVTGYFERFIDAYGTVISFNNESISIQIVDNSTSPATVVDASIDEIFGFRFEGNIQEGVILDTALQVSQLDPDDSLVISTAQQNPLQGLTRLPLGGALQIEEMKLDGTVITVTDQALGAISSDLNQVDITLDYKPDGSLYDQFDRNLVENWNNLDFQ